MRDIKNRTGNHSLEFADAREEQTGVAPEYAPLSQEFADISPEFTEPEEHVSSIPEEFRERGSKKAAPSPGKLVHRLLKKAGYLVIAAVGVVTLVNSGMDTGSSALIEEENISSQEDEIEGPAETVLPVDTEPEMTMQPTAEPEMTAQPTAEPAQEEEASISYIFSRMPVAAYEVTGLGVGRFESVYEEEIYVEYDDEPGEGYYFKGPLVSLMPGENTFVLFCVPGDSDEIVTGDWFSPGSYISGATIHSPSGSGQWEAITYTCSDGFIPEIEGFSRFLRRDTNTELTTYAYSEETFDGRINSLLDVWLPVWLRFAEIYHPDAQQDDAIFVIEVMTYPGDEQYVQYWEMDGVLEKLKVQLNSLGATSIIEIPVEEALERCNVMVSQDEQ